MRSILILFFVTACSGGGATPDATVDVHPPPDAMNDAISDAMVDALVDASPDAAVLDTLPPGDAPAQLPACDVSQNGVFVVNAGHLVVHAADGTPLCRFTPFVNGDGRLDVPVGGAITIVPRQGRGLVTIMKPQAGDSIDLRVTQSTLQYDVTLDVPPFPGATDYRVTCPYAQSLGEMPGTVRVSSSCLGTDNLVHTIILARDDNSNLLAYGTVALRPTNVSFVTQGTPQPTPTWVTTFTPLTVTLQNAPVDTSLCHGVIVGGVLNKWGMQECVPAGTTVPMPTIGDALVVMTRLNAREEEMWLDARRYPIGTQSVTFDAATQALPRVLATAFVGTATRPSVSWTTSRPIDRGSQLVATAQWERQNSSTQWLVVAPIDTPSPILFPRLPADLQPTAPLLDPELFIWDADGAPYQATRLAPFHHHLWPLFMVPGPTTTKPAPSAWGLSVRGDYDP